MSSSQQFAPPRWFQPPQYGETVQCQDRWYQLGVMIGQGHYGAVYECTDEWGNDLVAKILLPNRSYEEVQQRWLAELTNLLSLRHPNVTYVYDAFEYRDTFYLIIERCAGNLFEWTSIRGEAWLPYVARDLLQAIDFIHSRGYVHKDIHAGNLLVRWVGERASDQEAPRLAFKLGDLGIAKLQGKLSETFARWMLPPESIAPQRFGAIGPQIDIYHAGLLLLQLLVPQPIQFTNEEILAGKPREVAESLTSPYAGPLAAALRRHVGQRTQSARALWREIRGASRS